MIKNDHGLSGFKFFQLGLERNTSTFPYRRSWAFTGTLSFDYSRTFSRQTNNHHLDFGLCFYQVNGKTLVGSRGSFSVSSIIVAFREEVSWVDQNYQLLAPRIGYRYQRPQGGFTWRAGIHPFFYSPRSRAAGGGAVFFPTPHVGLGWNF